LAKTLGLGIIGLGRLWEARHKPALGRMRDRFRVVAVYDQVARRAEIEARQIGCAVADGLADLVHRPDVDAIYLLTPQWFGLHPVSLAIDAGKAIYCALPAASDPQGLEALAPEIRRRNLPYMPELPRRFYPATRRRLELLNGPLGHPRLILGHARFFGFDRYDEPGPSTQLAPASLRIDPGGNLIDWCRRAFAVDPSTISGTSAQLAPNAPDDSGPDFESFSLEFPSGGLAQISLARYHRALWGDATRFLPPAGFQVFAERGAAWVEMPDRVAWSDASGAHDERLPMDPSIGEQLSDAFHRRLSGDLSVGPTLDDALAIARNVRKLQQSHDEARTIPLQG
jgi:predicted dehydrogenase